MRMPGIGELIIILAIVVLVFGAKKLPQLGDGIGRTIKNFKRGLGRSDELDVTPDVHHGVPDTRTLSAVERRVGEAEAAR